VQLDPHTPTQAATMNFEIISQQLLDSGIFAFVRRSSL
jgi:hypothetical protein